MPELSRKCPNQQNSGGPVEEPALCLRQGGCHKKSEEIAGLSEVAVFRVRLSCIVASELIDGRMGNRADKTERTRFQGTEFLGYFHNLCHAIILQQMLPVTILAIFQDTTDHIRRIKHRVNRVPLCIPKDVGRKALYVLFVRHRPKISAKIGKIIGNAPQGEAANAGAG